MFDQLITQKESHGKEPQKCLIIMYVLSNELVQNTRPRFPFSPPLPPSHLTHFATLHKILLIYQEGHVFPTQAKMFLSFLMKHPPVRVAQFQVNFGILLSLGYFLNRFSTILKNKIIITQVTRKINFVSRYFHIILNYIH